MKNISDLMIELDGANPETVNRIAWREGSLPVRLAMLGLASLRKPQGALWWGYPPGVFIGYKWNGKPMQDLVVSLAGHIRSLGYQAYLDLENLDENADAYFQIPEFIASVHDCRFYILLLTELSRDILTARQRKTTWIFDEYQQVVRRVNLGRLIIIPVLLEPNGMIDLFAPEQVIDLCATPREFDKLNDILAPNPTPLSEIEVKELSATVSQFDQLFLDEQWNASADVLSRASQFSHTFDHQFRRMIHAVYTADQARLDAVLGQLQAVYGWSIVQHLYRGYCTQHRIPNRLG